MIDSVLAHVAAFPKISPNPSTPAKIAIVINRIDHLNILLNFNCYFESF